MSSDRDWRHVSVAFAMERTSLALAFFTSTAQAARVMVAVRLDSSFSMPSCINN